MAMHPSEMSTATRHLATDDQGVGLRATWRPNLGFINLSLWRGSECTETFHLTPVEAARLIGFLAASLASVAVQPPSHALHVVPDEGTQPAGTDTISLATAARRRVADQLMQLAHRLRP